ncbi:MAG: hypothetical protein Kow0099_21640 [Candidatus Abyssubacteria bacterium]
MTYDPDKHHRRSVRLQGYDYSRAGAYFVTICAQNRECVFGKIVGRRMRLNDAGRIVQAAWNDLPNHYAGVELDAFVAMPNHVHGIVVIVGAGLKPAPTGLKPAPTANRAAHGLPEIVRAFKTFSSRRINELRHTPGARLWQRNYYEHIIRNEESMERVRDYIVNNPLQWELDRENPAPAGAGLGWSPAPTGDDRWRV